MLDNIQFSHDNEFKGFIKHKELLYEDFNINSLPKALDISMERKSLKINRFLEKYCLELNNHLTQLYGFARSTNGLLTDEYREKIWPVLAKNIPKAEKLNSRNNSQFSASVRDEVINSEHEYEDYSDSDFESALSTFSDNTSLGSNDKRNERKKNYFEDFSDNDFEEVIIIIFFNKVVFYFFIENIFSRLRINLLKNSNYTEIGIKWKWM